LTGCNGSPTAGGYQKLSGSLQSEPDCGNAIKHFRC